jgi:DNA-directed RNA polymerase specialized sigma24 family protein
MDHYGWRGAHPTGRPSQGENEVPYVSAERAELVTSHILSSRQKFLDYVRRRMADPELTEDILPDSLVKAVEAAPNLGDGARLAPWFCSILQNAMVGAYRRRGVQRIRVGDAELEELLQRPRRRMPSSVLASRS